MSLVSSLPELIPLLQGAARDTTYTKLVADRSWFDVLITIEQAVIPLLLIVLLAAIAFGVYKAGQGIDQVKRILLTSSGDISGAAHSVRTVAEDVRAITTSVRGDVEAVGETVRDVNSKIQSAVSHAETRVRRLDALVEVAQEEAEDFVVSAAATLRGMREGASVLRKGFFFARRNGLFGKKRRRGFRERAALRERATARALRRERVRERAGDDQPRIRRRVPEES
jgi:uncharacterized protein YoxC